MARNLIQCIIQNYTGPRTFDALQIPNGYVIKNVQLPHTISFQTKPLEKSIVFIAQTDDYQAFFISLVRDPIGFLEKSPTGVIGSIDDPDDVDPISRRSSDQFDPGEIYLESVGPNGTIAGEGALLYLKNDGSITLRSGKFKESIVIGEENIFGQDKIVITADNGEFNSNIGLITRAKSTFRFDEDNTIEVGNFRSPVPGLGSLLEIPINSLTLEPTGDVTLGNFTILGIKKAELNMSALGFTSLTTFSPLGVPLNTLQMTPVGVTTLDANIITFNKGIRGVARLNDVTTSNLFLDPGLFWEAWAALMSVFIAPTPVNEPGLGAPSSLHTAITAALTSAGVTVSNIPSSVNGTIITASTTVLAGG